jgi:hypothetical protein
MIILCHLKGIAHGLIYPGETEKAEKTVSWMFGVFVEIRYEYVQN